VLNRFQADRQTDGECRDYRRSEPNRMLVRDGRLPIIITENMLNKPNKYRSRKKNCDG